MKIQIQSFYKIGLFITLLTITFCGWSQEIKKNASRIKVQLGGGYEYSFLKDFNKEFTKNQAIKVYNHDLNSGWTINANLTYYLSHFFNVGFEINNGTYHLSGYKTNLSFEDPLPYGVSYTYDLEKDIYLYNNGYGITTTLYFDQFNKKKQISKFNFGFDLAGNYVLGEYKQITTSYQWGKDYGDSESENVKYKYVTIKAGLNVKYNLNQKIIHAIIFKCGFRKASNPEIPYPDYFPFFLFNKTKVDLSGFYANLFIELGWMKK